MPYFLSKPISAATTIGAQSVNGIKPILTSVISGVSEPAAQAEVRIPFGTIFINAAAPKTPVMLCLKKSRRALSTVIIGSVVISVLLF